jgi:hypothetical protein
MTIAAVTYGRDEVEVFGEWIGHHLTPGIGRIHIFDNKSENATRAKYGCDLTAGTGRDSQSWSPPTDPHKAAYAAGSR